MSQLFLPPHEFILDADSKLGRANGNMYQRHPGVEGFHDGQIMVRLKKKRFVTLDYSIQPTAQDFLAAASLPHVKVPQGAGKTPCVAPSCKKVGVPVCLYDSEPSETDSLYMRSGLCFLCQRNLNEKRRTERKRADKPSNSAGGPSLIYALGPSAKKFKLNGNSIQLNSDAIIINGAVEGTRHCGDDYGFQEIGNDLLSMVHESVGDTDRLVNAVSSSAATAAAALAAVADSEVVNTGPEAAAAATAPGTPTSLLDTDVGVGNHPSHEDINSLYDKAFKSMNKSIFLLSQWKQSWDTAIAAAQETVADPTLADAVASAAAVAAAVSTGENDQGSNMVSLLLAADKSNGSDGRLDLLEEAV